MSTDPYATPATTTPSSYRDDQIYRRGKLLIVNKDSILPHICIKTNEDLSEKDWRKKKKIYFTHPVLIVAIVFYVLPYIILALIFRKSGTLEYSLSKRAYKKIILKRWMFGLSIPTVLFGMYFNLLNTADPGPFEIGTFFSIPIVFPIIALILSRTITVTSYKNERFHIKGCHPDFLSRFPEI